MLKRTRTLLGSLAVAAVMSLAPTAGAMADTYWQCVPFARLVSGIQIFGDAYTWWKQAVGRYDTGFQPKAGAVLCFKPTERMKLGHVAVVSQVLTDRIVQITHANWSPIEGSRGKVEKDVTLVDVSPAGDWSQVKVWYDPSRDLGGSTYPTYGFIYPDANARVLASTGISKAENTVVAVAQSAANQMAAAMRPGAGALQMLSQAADSSDRIGALIAAATRGDSNNSGN
ncbi:CHAP domain-containing protein [Phenylobacterium hankyongense]|uniref:CHAP domain-containing protein n=1 Tax=Phenylobacterium hankyongense TaxID=1813876 RepID=A0A328AVV8_9CAUL|nr:CHAP domain-containing protein [Phenylobacterium hankyongense]RAK59262.1 CHAP domain-containing protein [Phenylobacterium hankyongense]